MPRRRFYPCGSAPASVAGEQNRRAYQSEKQNQPGGFGNRFRRADIGEDPLLNVWLREIQHDGVHVRCRCVGAGDGQADEIAGGVKPGPAGVTEKSISGEGNIKHAGLKIGVEIIGGSGDVRGREVDGGILSAEQAVEGIHGAVACGEVAEAGAGQDFAGGRRRNGDRSNRDRLREVKYGEIGAVLIIAVEGGIEDEAGDGSDRAGIEVDAGPGTDIDGNIAGR